MRDDKGRFVSSDPNKKGKKIKKRDVKIVPASKVLTEEEKKK